METDWTKRAAWQGLADGYWPKPPIVMWKDGYNLVRVWFRPAEGRFELYRWQGGHWCLVKMRKAAKATTPRAAREVALALLAEAEPDAPSDGAVSNPVGVRRDGRLATVRRR